VKAKKEEIKAIKELQKSLKDQFKNAKKEIIGIIMTNVLKRPKKETIKVRLLGARGAMMCCFNPAVVYPFSPASPLDI